MKSLKIILSLWLFVCAAAVAQTEKLLFYENFANWGNASENSTVKTCKTDYGEIKYFRLRVHTSQPKEWLINGTTEKKKYARYVEFAKGSTTINNDNSYLELPPLTFFGGGVVSIIYGAGSTQKKMRLQEWSGSAWVNADYEEIATAKSSVWYEQKWHVKSSCSKTLRLVLTNSGTLIVPEIRVTTNAPNISTNTDTVNFSCDEPAQPFRQCGFAVTGEFLSSDIIVDAGENSLVSDCETGVFYNSIYLPATGGKVFVQFLSQDEKGTFTDSIRLSSYGAEDLNVYLKAQVLNSPTTLDTPNTATDISISLQGNVLQIMDSMPRDYFVLTPLGQLIESGTTCVGTVGIPLSRGIYVVRVGDWCRKIFVGH